MLIAGCVEKERELHFDGEREPWKNLPFHGLEYYMGETPLHRPVTRFKIAYDPEGIRVLFRVEDRYVRAVARKYQDPVFRDSCVEFFFSPGPEVAEGYFNLEVNCCGIGLFEFHPPQGPLVKIPEESFRAVRIVHSLQGPVEEEVGPPLTWSVAFRIPVGILEPYCPVVKPAPGSSWRVNFHKCADGTSHPHWLTWAKVDHPTPRFHLPEFFGKMFFGE